MVAAVPCLELELPQAVVKPLPFDRVALLEQPFAKDDKKTVGKLAQEGGMKLIRFVRWELGKG